MSKNSLQAMLDQYQAATTSNSNDNAFDKANYFSTYLPDGIDSMQKRVRLLPTLDESSPFKEVEVHSMTVEGKNRKFTCIQHLNNEDCPFCEVRERLLSSGEKADEELAKNYKARKMYIVRVIDRELESEGVKFWRFPMNYKKDGILDKIIATMNLVKHDITDSIEGRDLILNVVRLKSPKGGSYPSVNSIQAFDKEPLSSDSELVEKWINDGKTWQDVYSVKGYDYLKLVATGKVPKYDKRLGKFVSKEEFEASENNEDSSSELDSKVSMGANSGNTAKDVSPVVKEETYSTVVEDEEEDGDLPF